MAQQVHDSKSSTDTELRRDDPLRSGSDGGRRLGMTSRGFNRWAVKHGLPLLRLSRKTIRYYESDLDRLLARLLAEAEADASGAASRITDHPAKSGHRTQAESVAA